MSKHESQKLAFDVQGRFLGFAAKDSYKLKYLRLATSTGESVIKLPKELRLTLYRTLTPGDWIHVSGYQELCPGKGTTKIKAYQVTPIAVPEHTAGSNAVSNTVPFVPKSTEQALPAPTATDKKTNILVCQKSDCCKRGGRALAVALQAELNDRGLADQVVIKPTGCMKQCKAGPNLVMPDKTRYSRIRPGDVADLVEKHFPAPVGSGVV